MRTNKIPMKNHQSLENIILADFEKNLKSNMLKNIVT